MLFHYQEVHIEKLRQKSEQDFFLLIYRLLTAMAISYNINNFIQYNDLHREVILKKFNIHCF